MRVRVSERSLRDVGARDLIWLAVLPNEGESADQSSSAPRSVMMVKPIGTSCDRALIPEPGDYFVIGRMARNEDGGSVIVNGSALFYPKFDSISVMERMGLGSR